MQASRSYPSLTSLDQGEAPEAAYRTLRSATDARREAAARGEAPVFGPAPRPTAEAIAIDHAETVGTAGPELERAVVGNEQDLRWQTALNGNTAGSQVAHPIFLQGDGQLLAAFNRGTVGEPGVGTVSASRVNTNLTAALPGAGPVDQNISANRDPYTTGVGYQAKISSGAGVVALGADIYGGRHIKGASLSTGASLGGASIGAGIGLTLVSRSEITPTETHHITGENELEILATYQAEVMPVVSVGLQGGELHAGGGLRLVGIRGRAAEHEKFVGAAQLGHELRRRRVWWRDLKETAEALGIIAGMRLPRAHEVARQEAPGEALRVGEKLSWVHTGGLIFGLSAGGMGVRAGATAKLDGQTKMVMTRPRQNVVELEVVHQKTAGLSVNVEMPVIAELFHTAAVGLARRRVFRFDISKPKAAAALKEALAGRMPVSLGKPTPTEAGMAEQFLGLLAGERLAEGVESVAIEAAEHHVSSRGVAALKPVIFTDSLDAIAHQHSRGESQRVVAAGGSALTERRLWDTRHTELLRLNREHTAEATIQHVDTLDDKGRRCRQFIGVRMGLVFDHARGSLAARQKVIRKLNASLDHQIPQYAPATVDRSAKISRDREAPDDTVAGRVRLGYQASIERLRPARHKIHLAGASYKVSLERLVPVKNLARLAAAAPGAIDKAAAAAGLPAAIVRAFVGSLAGASDEARGAALAAFVVRHRSRGVGVVERLVGDDLEVLKVVIDSSAYDEPLAKLQDQMVRLIGLEDKVGLRRELGKLQKLEREIEAGLLALNADPIFRTLDEDGFIHGLARMGESRASVIFARNQVEKDLAELDSPR